MHSVKNCEKREKELKRMKANLLLNNQQREYSRVLIRDTR